MLEMLELQKQKIKMFPPLWLKILTHTKKKPKQTTTKKQMH